MKTSISIGLRSIPLSAGLKRGNKGPLSRHPRESGRKYLRVIKDEELEVEISRYKKLTD